MMACRAQLYLPLSSARQPSRTNNALAGSAIADQARAAIGVCRARPKLQIAAGSRVANGVPAAVSVVETAGVPSRNAASVVDTGCTRIAAVHHIDATALLSGRSAALVGDAAHRTAIKAAI